MKTGQIVFYTDVVVRMSRTVQAWDPVGEQRWLAYKKEVKTWSWTHRPVRGLSYRMRWTTSRWVEGASPVGRWKFEVTKYILPGKSEED